MRRMLAVLVLAAAVLVGGGLAVAAWSTTTYDAAGETCATAWHYHPGSHYLPHGGEVTDAQRAAVARQCDAAGADAWHRGWLALGVAAAVAAACGLTLIVTRPRADAGK